MTLYCQDCGTELACFQDRAVPDYIESWPAARLRGCEYVCAGCGSVFRQGNLPLDDFVAPLLFAPAHVEAA